MRHRHPMYLTALLVVLAVLTLLEVALRDRSPAGGAPVADVTATAPAAEAPSPVAAEAPLTPPAATTSPVAPMPARAAASVSAHTAGMVVAVDPETGRLGMPEHGQMHSMTIEQAQALARAEGAGLVTVRHADGSESMEHEGRFTDFTVVRIGPDGKPRYGCAHGDAGVHHALTQPAHGLEEE